MSKTNPIAKQMPLTVGIIAVLGAGGFLLTRQAKSDAPDAPPANTQVIAVSDAGKKAVNIETMTVRDSRLPDAIQAAGQVLFPPDTTVKISPRLAGRIKKVYVRVGEPVAAGQTLAIMDSVDATSAQTLARSTDVALRQAADNLARTKRLYDLGTPDVTAAQSAVDQAKAAAIAAKDALERTKKQAEIGGFTQPPVEAAQNALITAKGALVQAQSDLAQAQRDRDRKQKLVEIGVAAASDLEASQNVLEKAQSAVASDSESVKLAEQARAREQKAFKTNLYSEQQIRAAESAYRQSQLQQDAAERSLRLAKTQVLRDVRQAQSDYRTAQFNAEDAKNKLVLLGQPNSDGSIPIKSPIGGVVTDRQVSDGQIVDQSQMTPWQMFVVSNASTVWVEADVYEKDIERVAEGQAARVHVAASPTRDFTGRVARIAPTLDKTSRAVKVRVLVPNPNGLLKDGMYAEVTLGAGVGKALPTVPLEAIQRDENADFVYVAAGKNYTKRQVQIGSQRDGKVEIVSGLRSGETIVTRGALFSGRRGQRRVTAMGINPR